MKRYDLVTNYRCGDAIEEMEPSADGEWVRYEDIAHLCDCAASGNDAKPKQHGADPHAKNCITYSQAVREARQGRIARQSLR